mgnify:CR=1 FL=1
MNALLYTLGAFGLILILARLKLPLWAAIVCGAITIGVLFGLSMGVVAIEMLKSAIQPKSIALSVIVAVLIGVSEAMRASGQIEDIVSLARAFLRRPAIAMAALPALIGLLPMPGGALFSAPMVESAKGDTKIGGDRLSAVNFWYRHIWEYWWPLYPGVILAVMITGGDFVSFILFQFPLTIIMAGAGLLILRKLHPDLHIAAPAAPRGTLRLLIRATSSIWVIVAVWVAVKVVLAFSLSHFVGGRNGGTGPIESNPALVALDSYAPIALGLIVSLIWTIRMNRLDAIKVRRALINKRVIEMMILVISVMMFEGMLEYTDATVKIRDGLTQLNVPILVVLAILPFIAGLVTGLAVGFVGTSFPIVMGLIAAMDSGGVIWPYVMFAYFFGHMGQMVSPMHLCYILSNRYFGTTFARVYRHIIPSVIVASIGATGYFIALKAIF